MKLRGIEDPCSNTITCVSGWVFLNSKSMKSEFFSHLKI
jgi:GTP cyclohydrolase I